MIHIGGCEPVRVVASNLGVWQAEVDASRSPYASHIRAADEEFSRRRAQVAFEPAICIAPRPPGCVAMPHSWSGCATPS